MHWVWQIKLQKLVSCNLELILNFFKTNLFTFISGKIIFKLGDILYNSSLIINSFNCKIFSFIIILENVFIKVFSMDRLNLIVLFFSLLIVL